MIKGEKKNLILNPGSAHRYSIVADVKMRQSDYVDCLWILKAAASTFKWIKQPPSHPAETPPDTCQIQLPPNVGFSAGQMRHTHLGAPLMT